MASKKENAGVLQNTEKSKNFHNEAIITFNLNKIRLHGKKIGVEIGKQPNVSTWE